MSDNRRPTARLGRVRRVDTREETPKPTLEQMLASEREEREADAVKMGEMLARVARAEARARTLGLRVAELERQLAAGPKKYESVPTLATARALAVQLHKVLGKVSTERLPLNETLTDLPATKSADELPTVRRRGTPRG